MSSKSAMQQPEKHTIPKIFVINLEHSPERRAYMSAQLDRYQLDYEFFNAIDGKCLSDEMLSWYDDGLREKTQWFPRTLSRNEIACAISHLLIYEKQIKENIKATIILEDDIVIDDDFVEIIKRQALFPKSYELLYYHHGKAKAYPTFRKVYKNYKIVRYRKQSRYSKRSIIYTSAYQITRAGAFKLLKYAYPIMMPADIFLGHLNIHHIKAYGIEPFCTIQNENKFLSIIGDRVN